MKLYELSSCHDVSNQTGMLTDLYMNLMSYKQYPETKFVHNTKNLHIVHILLYRSFIDTLSPLAARNFEKNFGLPTGY